MIGKKGESLSIGREDPFDDSLEGHLRRRIFVCTFSILAHLTRLDGGLKRSERLEIGRVCREILKLDQSRTKFAVSIFKEAMGEKTSLQFYLDEFKTLLEDKPKMLPWLIDLLHKIALADGVCTDQESAFIKKVASYFKVNESFYSGSEEAFSLDKTKYRKILGLAAGAPLSEIEDRFRLLWKEYDPKLVEEKGLPKEFIKLAEEKREIIEGAYLILKEQLEPRH